MPVFDVTIQGKTYHVEIPDPGETPLRLIVDGEPFEVSIVGTAFGAEVGSELAPLPRPVTGPTVLPPPRTSAPPLTLPSQITPGSHGVVAPMPGTILSIAVAVDQRVEPGDLLCVLEAMKMKNPIRATHSGTVTQVCVEAGKTVPNGEVLIRMA